MAAKDNIDPGHLNKRLILTRKFFKCSQADFAEICGVSLRTYQRMEADASHISVTHILSISDRLNLDSNHFLVKLYNPLVEYREACPDCTSLFEYRKKEELLPILYTHSLAISQGAQESNLKVPLLEIMLEKTTFFSELNKQIGGNVGKVETADLFRAPAYFIHFWERVCSFADDDCFFIAFLNTSLPEVSSLSGIVMGFMRDFDPESPRIISSFLQTSPKVIPSRTEMRELADGMSEMLKEKVVVLC